MDFVLLFSVKIIFCATASASVEAPFPLSSLPRLDSFTCLGKRLARSSGSALGAISGELAPAQLRLCAINENLFVSTSVWAGCIQYQKKGGATEVGREKLLYASVRHLVVNFSDKSFSNNFYLMFRIIFSRN